MIHVTLIKPSNRRFYMARWLDPVTELTKSQSTKTAVRRDAERFAARLEDELNSGKFKRKARVTWEELQKRYKAEVSIDKADRTGLKTESMFNAITEHFNPKMASAVADVGFIAKYVAKLRELERQPYTIRGHLAELRKVLRWAKRMDLITVMPHIEFPRASSGMKGRPITTEEFDRILAGVDKHTDIIQPQFAASWRHYLRGLWLSSLRLEESMKLHWTSDKELCVDFTHRRPMFRIQAASEKGRKFRLLPMTPDFAKFLDETPKSKRHGFVFNPLTFPRGKRKGEHRPLPHHCGKVIGLLGEKANVKVNETKFASAHDFRRAFGYRWSKLLMPKVLQELMRHESIQTTMTFYVGSMAEDAADAVWKAMQPTGNTSGNTDPEITDVDSSESSQTLQK